MGYAKKGKREKAKSVQRLEVKKNKLYTQTKLSQGRVVASAVFTLPESVVKSVSQYTDENGEVKTVARIREAEFETEYFVGGQVFSIEIPTHSVPRRAFVRFCKQNRIWLYGEDKPETNNGRARIVEVLYKLYPVEYKERPEQFRGYRAIITFYNITEEMRHRLMAQTWVKRSTLRTVATPGTASASHRLGERLKHNKESRVDKANKLEAFRKLTNTFYRQGKTDKNYAQNFYRR